MGRSFRAALRSEERPLGTPGEPGFSRVKVGRAEVLVTRLPSGEAVAFGATCPHQDTPLDASTFWEGKLRCGRHLYLYDVHTGENLLPARDCAPESLCRLKPGYLTVYRVEERDGWIWIADGPEPPPAAYDAAAERAPVGRWSGPPAMAAPAAPAATVPPSAPEGPLEHPPQTVTVRVGEEFELVLATTPRPAHLWRSAVSGSVAIVSEGFAPDPPPRHIARLVARTGGEAEVSFSYATPWDPTPVEIRSFVVRAEG